MKQTRRGEIAKGVLIWDIVLSLHQQHREFNFIRKTKETCREIMGTGSEHRAGHLPLILSLQAESC